jgi:hypothetical protein
VSPSSRTVKRVGMEQIYTIKSSQTSQRKTNYSVTRGVRLLTIQIHRNVCYWINWTCRFQEGLINKYVPLKYDRWRQDDRQMLAGPFTSKLVLPATNAFSTLSAHSVSIICRSIIMITILGVQTEGRWEEFSDWGPTFLRKTFLQLGM